MSLTVINDKKEYILLSYINNTFKMWYRDELWNDFVDLYYDNMLNLDSLFKLSNSKNLYNKIYCNDKLEFNNDSVFEYIKVIIKKNLSLQLNDWEKNKIYTNNQIGINFVDLRNKELSDNKWNNLSSYTPDTNLEDVINYSESNTTELDSKTEFNDYLIDLSGIADTSIEDIIKKNKFEKNNINMPEEMDNYDIKYDNDILLNQYSYEEIEESDQKICDYLKNEINTKDDDIEENDKKLFQILKSTILTESDLLLENNLENDYDIIL